MKYLDNYDFYTINENFDYNLLLENNKINVYKTIQDKTIKKLSLNLYFVGTFQMGVTVIYPVVEALVKNSGIPDVTPTTIVLLTIFAITQILSIHTEDTRKIKAELEKENLLTIAEDVKKSLLSIHKIFSFVGRSFGKTIDVFTDMLAYVGLGAPVFMALMEIISKEGLNLQTLPQKVIVFGAGAGIYWLKSLVETIVEMIKNKYKK